VKNDLTVHQKRSRDVLGAIWGIFGSGCPERILSWKYFS